MRLQTVIVVALLAASSAAHAGRQRAAVTAIDLGRGVPPYLRAKVDAQIGEGLAAAGYDVVPAGRVAAVLVGDLGRCRDGACLRAVGQALHVDAVVVAGIAARNDSSVITMRLYDAATARKIAEITEVCELCGEAELVERVGVAGSALRAQATEAQARSARRAALPEPAGTSIVPGAGAGAAGLVLAGAGVYLLAINGRGACSPGDTPAYPAAGAVIRYPNPADPSVYVCRDVYRTRTLGLVGVGVGVAAAAVGVTLIARARHHERSFEIAPVAGGASMAVGLTW